MFNILNLNILLNIGLIDILQEWNSKKKRETFWKVNFEFLERDGISSIPPYEYMNRFIKNIGI